MKIYIIAGEASGDIYGANLMRVFKDMPEKNIEIFGIGGEKMQEEGLSPLFDMSEISLMGFSEILPHLKKVIKRIDQTVKDIIEKQPDIVLTIDSPGFCCEVVSKLKYKDSYKKKFLRFILGEKNYEVDKEKIKPKFIHYVAPTVWAYKPNRVFKFQKLFDHLFAILPFEPEYFLEAGLPCTYVGHPITENKLFSQESNFKERNKILSEQKLFTIMAGSRKSEVTKMLPIFLKTIRYLDDHENIKIAVPIIPSVKQEVTKILDKYEFEYFLIENESDKINCFNDSDFAIVKSGTGSLEIAICGCPMVIAYKVSAISHLLIKMMVKIRYANLVNIIADSEIIPEFLQYHCKPLEIAYKINYLLNDKTKIDKQIEKSKEIVNWLGFDENPLPSERVANLIIKIHNND